jgi:hypothetical protein
MMSTVQKKVICYIYTHVHRVTHTIYIKSSIYEFVTHDKAVVCLFEDE